MKIVKQGSSYSYAVYVDGVSNLTGYTCDIQLRNKSGTLAQSWTVTATNSEQYGQVFVVALSPQLSESLTVGETYTLAAEVKNEALLFSKEACRLIKIAPQNVY